MHEELSHGFAECMQDSLYEQQPFLTESDSLQSSSSGGAAVPASPSRSGGAAAAHEYGGDGNSGGVDRAMLVLQLLLGAQGGPAPNFAHLLLGFNVQDGPEGVQLNPSHKMQASALSPCETQCCSTLIPGNLIRLLAVVGLQICGSPNVLALCLPSVCALLALGLPHL